MSLARRVALLAETALWCWVVAGVAALVGPPALAAVLVWVLALSASVIGFERRGGFRSSTRVGSWRLLAWHVSVGRTLAVLSQGFGLWVAIHIAPLWLALGAIASAILGGVAWKARRTGRPTLSLARAATPLIATNLAICAAAYAGFFGLACASVAAQPGVTTLLELRPVGAPGSPDPLLDRSCQLVRSITIDAQDGALLIACGPERATVDRDALIRLDPAHPSERRALSGTSAAMGIAIPGTELVAASMLEDDVVRLLDRVTLAPRASIPMRQPLALAWDADASRLLVANAADPSCVAAIDPMTARRVSPQLPGFEPTADQLRQVYLPAKRSLACRPGSCSPWRMVPLRDLGLVVVANFAGTCTWQAVSYDGLSTVLGNEWLSPARDVKLSPAHAEIGVAMSYRGQIAVLDAHNLRLDRTLDVGFGTMWFDWLGDRELLAGDYITGELHRFDATSGARRGHLGLGGKLRDVVFDAARGRAYAASQCGVYAIDPDVALRADPG